MKIGKCLNCETAFRYRTGQKTGKYCSNSCQKSFERKESLRVWLLGGKKPSTAAVKAYLTTIKVGCWICEIVEWCGLKLGLELDHINGNSTNDSVSNFRLVCPNCHSQTPTYKNKNRGRGRSSRRKFSTESNEAQVCAPTTRKGESV